MCNVETKSFIKIFIQLDQFTHDDDSTDDDTSPDAEENASTKRSPPSNREDAPTAKMWKRQCKTWKAEKNAVVEKHHKLLLEHEQLQSELSKTKSERTVLMEDTHKMQLELDHVRLEWTRAQKVSTIATNRANQAEHQLQIIQDQYDTSLAKARLDSMIEAQELSEQNRALTKQNHVLQAKLDQKVATHQQRPPSPARKRSKIMALGKSTAALLPSRSSPKQATRAFDTTDNKKAKKLAQSGLVHMRMSGKMSGHAARFSRAALQRSSIQSRVSQSPQEGQQKRPFLS